MEQHSQVCHWEVPDNIPSAPSAQGSKAVWLTVTTGHSCSFLSTTSTFSGVSPRCQGVQSCLHPTSLALEQRVFFFASRFSPAYCFVGDGDVATLGCSNRSALPGPRSDEVVAVASMNYDPIVSKVAEVLAAGRTIRKRDVE